MSINTLYELAGRNDDSWTATQAAMAIAITEQYQGGGITRSEYQEMMLDLTRMEDVRSQSSSLEMKTALVTAIYAVVQVAG